MVGGRSGNGSVLETRRHKVWVRGAQVAALGVVVIVAVVVLGPKGASTDYTTSGPPRELPGEQLAPATAAEFASILVGQQGTPVVVNVWASWCAPCRTEMPLLQRAATTYAGRVTFIGVASRDSRDAAAGFLDDIGVSYPSLFDASGDIRADLGLRGFPTTYLFDRDGELREAVVGGITEQRLAAQLEDLLR